MANPVGNNGRTDRAVETARAAAFRSLVRQGVEPGSAKAQARRIAQAPTQETKRTEPARRPRRA